MTALDLPSAVIEIPVSSKGGLMLSSPCQRRSIWPVVGSSSETELPPSECWVK